MEVSNEIKEDIRKTQSDLKNAIRLHQVWVTRLREDENNLHLKSKVKEAENEIIAIGQAQKLVVDRLRRELELYQQRLKARNKQTNIENDNRYVAQQLRDYQLQYRSRNRTASLLKPSVLNEIHIKSENYNDVKENISDSETEIKSTNEKGNSNHSDAEEKEKYLSNFQQIPKVHDSRNNFANALNKVKEAFIGSSEHAARRWQEAPGSGSRPGSGSGSASGSGSGSGSESPRAPLSPSPPPPPLPPPGEPLSQELFLRLMGLVTPAQRELAARRRSERRQRERGRNDFLYGNYDMMPKRKKYNQFPYLQSHNDPPQTRSAKLRKQQFQTQSKESREGSPSGASSETKAAPGEAAADRECRVCGRDDVPSLLVRCSCGARLHTGCGAGGRCACGAALPEPEPRAPAPRAHQPPRPPLRDKLAERARLQARNIELCVELRKLEARAAALQARLQHRHAHKRRLLADQIATQRHLHKLLAFISHFKDAPTPTPAPTTPHSSRDHSDASNNDDDRPD